MTNETLVGLGADEATAMPTHELMSWLNDAERDRFVKFQETFETAGWRLIIEYCNAKVVQHGIDGANATTWEQCLENRGARLAWDRVKGLADEFMSAFEQMAEANKLNADESAESPE